MHLLLQLTSIIIGPLSVVYILSTLFPRRASNGEPISYSTTTVPPSRTPPLPSLILPCTTAHKRILPKLARHAFSYPLLYLGVDVEELEAGRLDVPWWFHYGDAPLRAVLTLCHKSYLANPKPHPVGFRGEMLDLLSQHGVDQDDVGRMWLVTMPSYLGKAGINPLSVWFVYDRGGVGKVEQREEREGRDSDDDWVIEGGVDQKKTESGEKGRGPRLLACVLEVHNTFGERHTYILRPGPTEAPSPLPGHHHSWIFPRTFHVSPFNNRLGFYKLDLCDPFHPCFPPGQPEVLVTLHQLTEKKEPKIFANLKSNPSRPPVGITSSNIINHIFLRQPFDLLLTTPRILRQAFTLHYAKRLLIFPRPELVGSSSGEPELGRPWNDVQEDKDGVGRDLGWKKVPWTEKVAERLVTEALERRAGLGVEVEVGFSSGRKGVVINPGGGRKLRIWTRHPRVFTELVTAKTGNQFLLAAKAERHTFVSDEKLFSEVFAPSAEDLLVGRIAGITDGIRTRHVMWLFGYSLLPVPPHILFPLSHSSTPHFLSSSSSSLTDQLLVLYIVATGYWAARVEEWVMWRVGARFVEGKAPWEMGRRMMEFVWGREGVMDIVAGSVLAGKGE